MVTMVLMALVVSYLPADQLPHLAFVALGASLIAIFLIPGLRKDETLGPDRDDQLV